MAGALVNGPASNATEAGAKDYDKRGKICTELIRPKSPPPARHGDADPRQQPRRLRAAGGNPDHDFDPRHHKPRHRPWGQRR